MSCYFGTDLLIFLMQLNFQLWLINSGEGENKVPSASYHNSLSYHGSAVNALRFSPSGKKLLILSKTMLLVGNDNHNYDKW